MPKGIYPRPEGYRPRKKDPPELVELVRKEYEQGRTQAEIAQMLGRSIKFVQGMFRRNEITPRVPKPRDQTGPKNGNWKDEAAGYKALHLRVYRTRGCPIKCSVCQTTTAPNFDWANLTGRYQDVWDYAPMCRSCHRIYDNQKAPTVA